MGRPSRFPLSHLQYLRYVLRHKWFVFVAGLRLHVPAWRLIIHDWSKFLPCEWFPYTAYFYGDERDHSRFHRAWLHHQHFNPHHWQHWVLREDNGDTKLLPMPEHLVREMVADWCGAGRAMTGNWEVAAWYKENAHKIQTNQQTTWRVLELIDAWESAGHSA